MSRTLKIVKLIKENRKVPEKELVNMIMEKFGIDRNNAWSNYRYAKKVYWLKVDCISSIKDDKPIKAETDIADEDVVFIRKEYASIDPSFDMMDQPVYLDNYSPAYFQNNKEI